jgi:hypothetical protein
VRVGHDETHTQEPSSNETPEEGRPSSAVLAGHEVQAQDLAEPRGVHASGDERGDRLDPTGLSDLLREGVDPHVRVGTAVEWTGPERLDGLIELLGHLRDPGLRDPLDPELTDQPFDTPGGHAADVALCDDLDEGSLGTPAGLEEPLGEVGAFTELRDGQRDRAGAGVPGPFPVAVPSVGPLG